MLCYILAETESIKSADFEKNGVGCKSSEVSVESKEVSEFSK